MSPSKDVSSQTLQSSLESYSESTNDGNSESAQSILTGSGGLTDLPPTSSTDLGARPGGVTGSTQVPISSPKTAVDFNTVRPLSSRAAFCRRECDDGDASLLNDVNPERGLKLEGTVWLKTIHLDLSSRNSVGYRLVILYMSMSALNRVLNLRLMRP